MTKETDPEVTSALLGAMAAYLSPEGGAMLRRRLDLRSCLDRDRGRYKSPAGGGARDPPTGGGPEAAGAALDRIATVRTTVRAATRPDVTDPIRYAATG
jgi:hypothetical protein